MDSKQNRMSKKYQPIQLLSQNEKTTMSINLPIRGHCTPSPRCKRDCYGKSGHIISPNCKRKQRYVSEYLKGDDIQQLIWECNPYSGIRLNGVGDLLPAHIPTIFKLAENCPNTTFWGMTRKVEIANEINKACFNNLSLLVSVDATSKKSDWNYQGALCYGPRRAGDQVPNDQRIITVFPRHHAGRVDADIPHDVRDCLSARKKVNNCASCQRCWNINN